MDLQDTTLFPPMAQASTSAVPSSSHILDRLWSNIIAAPAPSAPHIPVSLMETPEEVIPFDADFTGPAAAEWNLCLVGYSIGKRPFYEALKETAIRIWKLKGTFQLIALTDGFFLFKFSLAEDFDMVWSKGAWFFHGKPFIMQKWTKNFNPTRENFSSVPVWVRVHKLPLVCWNSVGISKIASKIGIPIAVDALTAAKTRLTYARICIQVSTSSSFPETVTVAIEGEVIKLQIQYEWKPVPCATCASLTHVSSNCPSAQSSEQVPQSRGRSNSRGQRKNSHSRSKVPPQNSGKGGPSATPSSTSLHNQNSMVSNINLVPSQVLWVPKGNTAVSHFGVTTALPDNSLQHQTVIPPSKNAESNDQPSSKVPVTSTIPNLNSPTDEGLGDTDFGQSSMVQPPIVNTSNKFSSLQGSEELMVSNADNDATSISEQTSNTSGGNKLKSTIPKNSKGKSSKKPPSSSAKRK
ncbi:hypothetical protein KFK09_017373 [Dendrobium nobile]|uniref:DUF4283 domain-containing protein n=1 Tax=Dendrobium nobile TaxID=94219 RepID=A0A8T3B2C6_DENNO|nr:hypothetical protein KFK09_017373 [Dendrobium nobile]